MAKTVFVACVVAALFPPAGQPRPVGLAFLGMVLAAVLAVIGVALDPGEGSGLSRRRGRR